MPKLERFSTPARLPDPDPGAWSDRVRGLLSDYVDGSLPQFYDPTQRATPAGAAEPMISWGAFPARVEAAISSKRVRWKLVDGDRSEQDEYCEWSAERKDGKLVRVTFTTELPEYFEHLNTVDPGRLVERYRELVDSRVKLRDLRTESGIYRRENRWNSSRPGRIAHLMQGDNNLSAAIDLIARATVQRKRDGAPVTNQQELVACSELGNPLRNSDPQIASSVNVQAGLGNEIALADPPGLHLGRPLTGGMVTPDGADAADFWKIVRGDEEHTLRARFEVPKSRGYVLGDIEANGRPLKFGSQLAERVLVWVKATIKPANHQPQRKSCGA